MNDCVNVEMRDRLPDLLNGTLPVGEAADVSSHVATCDACSDEFALLRSMRGAMIARTPRIDYAAIVDRIPAPNGTVMPARRRMQWGGWRMAAAASIVAVVGATATMLHSNSAAIDTARVAAVSAPAAQNVRVTPSVPANARVATNATPAVTPSAVRPSAGTPAAAVASRTVASASPKELALHGELSDLSDGQIQALLADLDHIDAVPPADVDPDAGGEMLTNGGGF